MFEIDTVKMATVLYWIAAMEESDLDPYEKHLAYVYAVRIMGRPYVALSTAEAQRITGISKTKCHHSRKRLLDTGWLKRNPGQHCNARIAVTLGDITELDPALARDLHYGMTIMSRLISEKADELREQEEML